jgi:hypothetical protein
LLQRTPLIWYVLAQPRLVAAAAAVALTWRRQVDQMQMMPKRRLKRLQALSRAYPYHRHIKTGTANVMPVF